MVFVVYEFSLLARVGFVEFLIEFCERAYFLIFCISHFVSCKLCGVFFFFCFLYFVFSILYLVFGSGLRSLSYANNSGLHTMCDRKLF